MQSLTELWTALEALPTPPMSISLYLGLSILSVLIGTVALRGRPTKGA